MSRYFSKLAQRTGLNSGGRNFPVNAMPARAPSEGSRQAKWGAPHADLAVISELKTVPSVGEGVVSRRQSSVGTTPPGSTSPLAGRKQPPKIADFEALSGFRLAAHQAENESAAAETEKEKVAPLPEVMGEKKESEGPESINRNPVWKDRQSSLNDNVGAPGSGESSQSSAFSYRSGAPEPGKVIESEVYKFDKKATFGADDTPLRKSTGRSLGSLAQETDRLAPEAEDLLDEVFEKKDTRGIDSPVGLSEVQSTGQTSERAAIGHKPVSHEKNSAGASRQKRESVEIKIGTISMEVYQATQPKAEPQHITPLPVVKKRREQPPSSRLGRFYLKGW